MCFSERVQVKNQLKCTIIAVVSLVLYMILLCFGITALMLAKNRETPNTFQDFFNSNTNIFFRNMDIKTSFVLSGILIAFGILGVVASVILVIGSKCNKPACLVVYVIYSVQSSIILLIGGLLLCISLHWEIALVMLCLFGPTCHITVTVNTCYEDMVQDALLNSQNGISDLTLLINAESDDLTSIPAE